MRKIEMKYKFRETCMHHCELDSFPILKDFADEIGGNISECNF